MADDKGTTADTTTDTSGPDAFNKTAENTSPEAAQVLAGSQSTGSDPVSGDDAKDTEKIAEAPKTTETSDAPKTTAKKTTRSRSKVTASKDSDKSEDKADVTPGIDPITGMKSSFMSGDDIRNSTVAQEDTSKLDHDGIPDPNAHRDASRNVDDSAASSAIAAEADPDIPTDPAVMGYQVRQYDPSNGQSILSVLANPPVAAVEAEIASQAGIDGTNGVNPDANGDELAAHPEDSTSNAQDHDLIPDSERQPRNAADDEAATGKDADSK